jgi:predicted dinucleotide-binding enzyme
MAADILTIAVLGAGNIGGTLGPKWVTAGHRVAFGVSDLNGKHAQAVRDKVGEKAEIGTIENALNGNPEVVLLALPGPIVGSIITTYAKQLDGRIIIDATNNVEGGAMNSFATLQQQTPQAQIFRAFNTYGVTNFENSRYGQDVVSLFFCGPDGDARTKVEQLITEVGPEPVYVGGVDQVNVVDGVTRLWFALTFKQRGGPQFAFKLLTR